MRQTETHTLTYWRDINALLAAEGEPPATAAEIANHRHAARADERAVFAIVRRRIQAGLIQLCNKAA